MHPGSHLFQYLQIPCEKHYGIRESAHPHGGVVLPRVQRSPARPVKGLRILFLVLFSKEKNLPNIVI